MKKTRTKLTTLLFVFGTLIIFYIVSQMYSADEQIFLTEAFFIKPKSQPILFILMWFVNIGLMLFAIWLGKLIAVFLWAKEILFQLVGTGLVLGAGILAYNFLVLQEEVKTTTDLIAVLVLCLFVGGLGFLMLLSSLINKKRDT